MGLDERQPLDQQLQAAREEAELTLEQLHLVQEELEIYLFKAQDLEKQLQSSKKKAQQLESLCKDRNVVAEECEKHKAAVEKVAKEAKAANKERDDLSKQLELLCKERDVVAEECEKQRVAADKAFKESKETQKQCELIQEAHDHVVLELDKISSQAKQKSDLLKTAQRMLDGQARYLEDLSLKEEQAEQAMDELRLLKQEIFHYIQNSRPLRSLDPDRISRLIELVKMPAPSKPN